MSSDAISDLDVAIIGLACRFPGAPDHQAFWENLAAGKESITRFSVDELVAEGWDRGTVEDDAFVRAAPIIEDAACFDAKFFNYTPNDATFIDPQQRLLLELAWSAFESAGYDVTALSQTSKVGVFAGTALNTYAITSGLTEKFSSDYLPFLLGADKDYIATRIAYKLNLSGPAVTVQTACSTSLVALHQAVQSLINGESELCLVGASAIRCPIRTGHGYQEGSVFSADGHCRPFDKNANGTIFGSGAACVLLKPLATAVEDGDTVWGVIKGSAINNDGSSKADFTAPSVVKQSDVILEALGAADIDARDVEYVEAHGTGTFLGDPIEIEALSRAFRVDTSDEQYCLVGSVKSNIGHLDAAAGLASLVKVLMALKNQKIPQTVHFTEPNPHIDFAHSPFKVCDTLTDWPARGDKPRTVGITSLGMGGTNAHVILQDYPSQRQPHSGDPMKGERVFRFSARSDAALERMLDRFVDFLDRHPDSPLQDVAYTLAHGRATLSFQRAFMASDLAGLRQSIVSRPKLRKELISSAVTDRRLYFAFPGQGSQYIDMAKDLYQRGGVFAAEFDVVASAFSTHGIDVKGCVYGNDGHYAGDINQTALTQPCLFAIEYAYAKAFLALGVMPDGLIGHSIGEITAAAISGVFELSDAVALVYLRGKLMQSMQPGSMLAVSLAEDKLRQLLDASVEIAVINSESACVVSGDSESIAAFAASLDSQNIDSRALKTSHAFHSRMMRDAADAFRRELDAVTFHAPQIPFISNTTGTWITESQACDPSYWSEHICNTVYFNRGIDTLFSGEACVLVEMGPGTTLTQYCQQSPKYGDTHLAIASSRHVKSSDDDCALFSQAVGLLYTLGCSGPWAEMIPADGQRLELPTYPFERSAFWYSRSSGDIAENASTSSTVAPTVSAVSEYPGDWVWQESWSRLPASILEPENDPLQSSLLVLRRGDEHRAIADEQRLAEVWPHISTIERTSDYQQLEATLASPDWKNVVCLFDDHGLESVQDVVNDLWHCARLSLGVSRTQALNVCILVVGDSDASVSERLRVVGSLAHAGGGVAIHEFANCSWNVTGVVVDDLYNADRMSNVVAARFERSLARVQQGQFERLAFFPTPVTVPESDTGSPFHGKSIVIFGATAGIAAPLIRHVARHAASIVCVVRPSGSTSAQVPRGEQQPPSRSRQALQHVLDALPENSATVETVTCDMTSGKAVEQLLQSLTEKIGSVDYIVNLIGAISDKLLSRKPVEEVLTVFDSKVGSSRYILDACLASDLKSHVVLFSSTAAYLSPAGQFDYAMANRLQLEMPDLQRYSALTVSAIAWPGWQDTGMFARAVSNDAQLGAQVESISVENALAILDAVVQRKIRSCLVSRAGMQGFEQQSWQARVRDSRVKPDDSGQGESSGKSIAERITHHWSEVLGYSDISPDDDYFDLGGSSLLAVKLFRELEIEFACKLPVESIFQMPTIASQARHISSLLGDEGVGESASDRQETASVPAPVADTPRDTPRDADDYAEHASEDVTRQPTSGVVGGDAEGSAGSGITPARASTVIPLFQNGSGRPPVFFVHSHGGVVVGYRHIAKAISPYRDVFGIQAVGVDGRQEPLTSLQAMAERYADDILATVGNDPIYLAGYCMGGTICWAVAEELRRRNRPVSYLAMIQCFHKGFDYPVNQGTGYWYPDGSGILHKGLLLLDKVRYEIGKSSDGFLEAIGSGYQRLRRRFSDQKVPERGAELQGFPGLLKVHAANSVAFDAFDPAPLDVTVGVFVARQQPLHVGNKALLGWDGLVQGDVSEHWIDGSYLGGLDGLDIQQCAELLEMDIHRLESRSG